MRSTIETTQIYEGNNDTTSAQQTLRLRLYGQGHALEQSATDSALTTDAAREGTSIVSRDEGNNCPATQATKLEYINNGLLPEVRVLASGRMRNSPPVPFYLRGPHSHWRGTANTRAAHEWAESSFYLHRPKRITVAAFALRTPRPQ